MNHANRSAPIEAQHARGWVLVLAQLCLLAVSLWAYRGVLDNEFVWDSKHYLLSNEQWISGLSLDNLWWMLTSLEESNWHPLTWLSWALDYQLYGGLDPGGFHLTNVVIHGLNAGLLFLLILALFGFSQGHDHRTLLNGDMRAIVAAFLAAMVFAVHPQHVESVAWVAERKDVLCQLFLLLTLLAWLRFQAGYGKRAPWYLAAVLCAIGAALSKPMAVSLPVILLLLDAWPLDRFRFWSEAQNRWGRAAQLVIEKWPFVLISTGLVGVTLIAQAEAMAAVPFDIRVVNAFSSYLAYLSKWLIPLSYSPHYPFFTTPEVGILVRHFIPVAGFLAITIATLFLWTRGRRFWLIAWSIYVVALLPVIGLVSVGTQGMADRYTYFPMLPVYALLAAGSWQLSRRSRLACVATSAAMILLCVFLMALTARQVGIWKNEISLWSQAVRTFPTNGTARNNLGLALLQIGANEQALAQFDIVARLPYLRVRLEAMRAYALMRLGRFEEALEAHRRLEASAPYEPEVAVDWDCFHYNVGWLMARLGRRDDALEQLGLVDPDGAWHETTAAWLDRLKAGETAPAEVGATEALPGYCPMLVPVSWRQVTD